MPESPEVVDHDDARATTAAMPHHSPGLHLLTFLPVRPNNYSSIFKCFPYCLPLKMQIAYRMEELIFLTLKCQTSPLKTRHFHPRIFQLEQVYQNHN